MGQTLQPNNKDWMNGCNKKAHICAVYMTHISDLGTCKEWKRGVEKKIYHANGNEEKTGIVIVIPDVIDF